MNHPVPDELISAYFDGEVTPDERSQVEHLLESSPEFRQLLDETSRLSALLHSFPREAAPPELAANVNKQVQNAVQVLSFSNSNNRRSLRREWTAFSVGILTTVASLLMFVRFNQPAGNTHFFTDEPSIVSEARQVDDRLSKQLNGVAVADAERGLHRERAFVSAKAEPEQPNFKQANAEKPVERMDALNLYLAKDAAAPDLPALTASDADFYFNSLQAQIQTEFLASLTNGDVIVTRVADPDNTIAVVYFTVVDIMRETDDLKILLQKRSVKQLDDVEASALPKQNRADDKSLEDKLAEKESFTRKKSPRSDELQLFFVRAPGDQLAAAIVEFRKNHPDLYWTPQSPIELPQNSATQVADGLGRSMERAQVESDRKRDDDPDDSVALTAEADLVIGEFLARNSAVVSAVDSTSSSSTNESEAKFKQDALSTRMMRSNSAIPALNQPVLNAQNSFSDSTSLGLQPNGVQGYFRVSVQNQALPVSQTVSTDPAKNPPVPLLANLSTNTNGVGGGMNSRFGYAVPNTESRNTRPVKMLIVLKSQQAPSNNVP